VFRSTHGDRLGSLLADTTVAEARLCDFFKTDAAENFTSLCVDGHVNLRGCALLASLVPQYYCQYYTTTTGKQDANEHHFFFQARSIRLLQLGTVFFWFKNHRDVRKGGDRCRFQIIYVVRGDNQNRIMTKNRNRNRVADLSSTDIAEFAGDMRYA
jgi:hypothetical protein